MKIAIWSCARISSSRCKKKMIRNFAGTTLTDIFLKKLNKLNKYYDVFFAGHEKIFKKKCEVNQIPFVQRNELSTIIDEPAAKIYHFLKEQNYDYFLQVNACMPFLKVETIKNFLLLCKKIKNPCFSVFKINNYFLSKENKAYNFKKNLLTINTKNVQYVKEFAHALYFFKKDYFVKNGWYWNWNKLKYINIPKNLETLDIDTEQDFILAEKIWKSVNKFSK